MTIFVHIVIILISVAFLILSYILLHRKHNLCNYFFYSSFILSIIGVVFLSSNDKAGNSGGLYIAYAFLLGITLLYIFLYETIANNLTPSDLSKQIKEISTNLNSSANELVEVQKNLKKRITIVENLKKEADHAVAIKRLSKEQIAAINKMINNKSKYSLLKNVLFFILGIIIPYIIDYCIK